MNKEALTRLNSKFDTWTQEANNAIGEKMPLMPDEWLPELTVF